MDKRLSLVIAAALLFLAGFLILMFQKDQLPQEAGLAGGGQANATANAAGNLAGADSPFGIHPAVPYEEAREMGVKWTRGGASPYFFWSFVDQNMTGDEKSFVWKGTAAGQDGKRGSFDYDAIGGLDDAGFNVLYNIEVQPPGTSGTYRKPYSYLPSDTGAYRNFVKAAVRRYPFINYWQVGNEPAAGPADYGEFLCLTYGAVKEADPDATVLIGGAGGMAMPHTFGEYRENFDAVYLPLLEDLAKQNKRCFDIFDFHLFGNASGDYRLARQIREYVSQKIGELGIPQPEEYWVTETGTYSGDPKAASREGTVIDPPYQTERQQAGDLVRRYAYSLGSGIKKVFWAWGLTEGFHYNEGFFDFTGLIYDGRYAHDGGAGVKKLSYYSYKKMVEVLEGSDWNSIHAVQEADGVYAYMLTKNGSSVWVAWNDNGEQREIELAGISSSEVKITEAVPKYGAGREVTDYNTAFNAETKKTQDGRLTIVLKDVPVFVEER